MQRYTLDIDFSLHHLTYNSQSVVTALKDICQLEYNDGVFFDYQNITITEIKKDDVYGGLRAFIPAQLDTIQQNLQVDIGYGDKIFPKPVKISFPMLIDSVDTAVIYAYSVETVIAEKFHAMIELAELNSRMKDFYDIYFLLKSKNNNNVILREAIISTFENRKTKYTYDHVIFTDGFANDVNRNKMWKAFQNKINADKGLRFADVIQLITNRLQPIWETMKKES